MTMVLAWHGAPAERHDVSGIGSTKPKKIGKTGSTGCSEMNERRKQTLSQHLPHLSSPLYGPLPSIKLNFIYI